MLCASALSGCALGDKLSKPNAPLPAAYEAPQTASKLTPAALDRWWLLFDDPQLTGLIEQALSASPDAKTAFYRLGEARADRAETIAGVLPQGDLKASGQDEYARQNFSNLDAGIPPQFRRVLHRRQRLDPDLQRRLQCQLGDRPLRQGLDGHQGGERQLRGGAVRL